MVQADSKNKDAPKPVDSTEFVTCFTDASYCDRTGAYGFCIWIRHAGSEPMWIIKGGVEKSNSTAIERKALEYARDYIADELEVSDKVVVLQSDCLNELESLSINVLREKGARFVKKKHVKAHTKERTNRSYVNRLVDKKARNKMREIRDEI